MARVKTFTVKAQRSGKWWALEVPEVPGVFSQVRRLDQAESMARDAIAAMLDVDPGSFAVELAPELAPGVQTVLEEVRRAKEASAEAQRNAAFVVHCAALKLTREDGFSMRDVGKVMGISHQRVAQILEENEQLGDEVGNLGGGRFGGAALPKGSPAGPHGAHEKPVHARAR